MEQITANLTSTTETAQTKWRLRTIYILMNVFNQMISVMKTLQESQESQMEQITANLPSTTETAQANKYFFYGLHLTTDNSVPKITLLGLCLYSCVYK